MKIQILFAVLGLISLVHAAHQNQAVGIEAANFMFNYELLCEEYRDCHNCTVSRCQWNVQEETCEKYEHYDDYQLHQLQISDFFKYGERCVDKMRFCEREESENKTTELSYRDDFTYLPVNYFCIFDMQNKDPVYTNDPSDFSITSGRTLYSADKIELERAFAMWNTDCSQVEGNDATCLPTNYMINDQISHDETHQLNDTTNLKIGFINIFQIQKLDAASIPDHFQLLLHFHPKADELESTIDKVIDALPLPEAVKHNKHAGFILLALVVSFALCICYAIYYLDKKERKKKMRSQEEYNDQDVIRAMQGDVQNPNLQRYDSAIQPAMRAESMINMLNDEREGEKDTLIQRDDNAVHTDLLEIGPDFSTSQLQ